MMVLLIGAGGHARLVAEILAASGDPVTAYVDPRPCDWLAAEHFTSDAAAMRKRPGMAVMGLGAKDVRALQRRMDIMKAYQEAGWTVRNVIHPSAVCSPSATIESGVLVMAAAVIQPGATLGAGAIVETSAIVEHDAVIGAGAHVAAGATVLGGAHVGGTAAVGAGAVVLPGAAVPENALVPALGRYP